VCGLRRACFPRRGTPLHTAANNGEYDVVRLLVANGADVAARDDDGGSAEYSRRRRCTFGCVLPSGHRRRRAPVLGPAYSLGALFWDTRSGRGSCNSVAHTVASQVRSPCIGRARNRTTMLQTYSAMPVATPFGCRRLVRRNTPRDVADDKGAFDAAVKVRRTAADRRTRCSRVSIAGRIRCRPRGRTSPSRRRSRRRRRRRLPTARRAAARRDRAAERIAGRVCSQAFRFKVGDDVVDQDGERCRVASVDTEDLEKPYELEYPNGSKFWAAESAIRRHKVSLSGRRWMCAR
jgi:hypothetical protein